MGKPPEQAAGDLPEHLRRWPGLYVRDGDRIVEAPAEDRAVARGYPAWPDKGPVVNGIRLTIMSSKLDYRVGEEIRVIHVLEATEPGLEVYVMGPKPVYGERIDGQPATPPPPYPEDPLAQPIYDGPVLTSPAVDYNYEVTSHVIGEPGTHAISWQPGMLRSNTLVLRVHDRDD